MTVIGALAGLVGLVVAFVFFLQPWRSCPEDDSPTGCVALPIDTTFMVLGLIVAVAGLILFVVGRSVRARDMQSRLGTTARS
jgi:hypothetical protein